MQRSELRQQLRLARQQLTRAQQDKAAEAVLQRLCDLPLLSHATYAACYLPNDGEVSLTPFIKHCWQSKATSHPMRCNTTLPVLHPVCKGHLLFLGYDAQTHMVKNTFAIPEPELACQNIVPTRHHSVIFMPLVGFDSQGNRLGMGGGFYDRTLASVREAHTRPALVGIAHDCQHVDRLPVQSWDVPLDAIVTPTQTITFNQK